MGLFYLFAPSTVQSLAVYQDPTISKQISRKLPQIIKKYQALPDYDLKCIEVSQQLMLNLSFRHPCNESKSVDCCYDRLVLPKWMLIELNLVLQETLKLQ